MANWGVVIGIDQYWSEGAHLRGAVRDALSVREWLVDPTGGNVPPENIQLVLSRADHSPEVDEGLAPTLATKANIILAINNLMDLSGGKERLYFFFAGHGLTTRVSNRDERVARDRLHEHKHRPLDRAALALGVLRDDAIR